MYLEFSEHLHVPRIVAIIFTLSDETQTITLKKIEKLLIFEWKLKLKYSILE